MRNLFKLLSFVLLLAGTATLASSQENVRRLDVKANVYMSYDAAIGKVLEEAIVGYHLKETFLSLGFMHAGMKGGFYGGTVNCAYIKPDAQLVLVPTLGIGFLHGMFSGDERTAKLAVNLDVELRQCLTESRSSYCGLGVKILGLKDVDISFWGGVTFGFSF